MYNITEHVVHYRIYCIIFSCENQGEFMRKKVGLVLSGGAALGYAHIGVIKALEEENILVLEKYANLSEKEKIEIKSLKRGECLMYVGENHILAKIEAADYEKEIIEKGKSNEYNNSNK